MDSFEFNKIAGAVLGSLLFLMGVGIVTDALFSSPRPHVAGYDLPAASEASAGSAQAATGPVVPIAQLLASADPKRGETLTKACQACHSFEKGAAAKIGPPLYGVVGRPVATVANFTYSDALKKMGGDWTFEALDKFIMAPQQDVKGTKMAFGGEKDPKRRADIIDYLHTLSDSPVPLPTP
jgi:cytochrome c